MTSNIVFYVQVLLTKLVHKNHVDVLINFSQVKQPP